MDTNSPISDSPLTNGSFSSEEFKKLSPEQRNKIVAKRKSDKKFFSSLSKLFGFRKTNSKQNKHSIQFVKVDPESDFRVAQSKIGKVIKTKMGDRLEELFNAWLTETTDSMGGLADRFKRIAELEFAINNDPFLGLVVDLIADEATQIDQQDKLITVDCANPRMKQRMEELLTQWSVTQNRVRGAIWNLAAYGDAFWANKITKSGVVRINPIDVRQVLDRLEFNPVKVASDLTLKQGFTSALNRDSRLQMLIDEIENEAQSEFADLFDSKLFGYVISNDFVVPPWNITHFRVQADQSDFAPFGKPMLLKALAPFRQANATMTLQSLARILNFPVTVYEVETGQGMDASQQFEKVNDAREQYDNIGVSGNNSETYSVNTKMWIPKGLVSMQVLSPNINLNAVEDLKLYQDRVVVSSGVPKGYLVPDWGGFGVSGVSLVEQFKPFARKVFSIQSAFLEGLTNLFRLHFAITGEFDYFEPFILGMKFPNSENSSERVTNKQNSLNLSKAVIDTVADLIGSLNDPLPPEIVQDILTKFSFLDPKDIKKWIKVRATQSQGESMPDESSSMGGGIEDISGGAMGGDSGDFGGDGEMGGSATGGAEGGDVEGSPDASNIDDSEFSFSTDLPDENASANDEEFATEEIPEETPEEPEKEIPEKEESYKHFALRHLTEKRYNELNSRYTEANRFIYESIIKKFSMFDEIAANNRHYKYSLNESSLEPMFKVLEGGRNNKKASRSLQELKEAVASWGFKMDMPAKEKEEPEENQIKLQDILNDFRRDIYTDDSDLENQKKNMDSEM